ncbi:MAG: DUF2497 domain-containing protein [Sphingobium sp.]|nr:DUF2497 domain-containing protein [Sphingobium sp.]
MGDMSKEPSMEEILSSIKRIIAEDTEKAASHRLNRGRAAVRTDAGTRETERESHRKAVIANMVGDGVGVIDAEDVRSDSQACADEILELTDAMPHEVAPLAHHEDVIPPSSAQSSLVNNAIADDTMPEMVPAQVAASTQAAPVLTPDSEDQLQDNIVSAQSENAARSSLAALSNMMVKSAGQGDPATLEDLVKDMLRPMLKEWLDANLPNMVEGMVAKEISRITGRPL